MYGYGLMAQAQKETLMNRERSAALLFVISALLAMAICGLTRLSLPLPGVTGKLAGEIVFVLGMALFLWAVISLKESFRGTVAPVSNRLVQTGPYRWIRHPLYLSMIITLIGFALAFRSLWGLISIFAFFLPAVIFRAKLEEKALGEKFGSAWAEYARRTHFIIPFLDIWRV